MNGKIRMWAGAKLKCLFRSHLLIPISIQVLHPTQLQNCTIALWLPSYKRNWLIQGMMSSFIMSPMSSYGDLITFKVKSEYMGSFILRQLLWLSTRNCKNILGR